MKKRILSALLVIAMLVCLCPVTVSAAPSLPENRILGSETVTQQNPLYPDVVYTDELVIPEAPATTLATSEDNYGDVNDIAMDIRDNMKKRNTEFMMYYHHVANSSDIEVVKEEVAAAFQEAFNLAVSHTGNPIEGDYLKWQWGRWGYSWSGSYSGNDYYLDFTVTLEYYTTADQEKEMDQAVEDLLDELDLDRKSDYQKVCGIYDYLCYNVVYDYDNLEDDSHKLKYTAYAALIDGTAVCQGYANLFYRLALELDVDNRLIAGLGNGGPHAWNIVELNDLYYNLDSTWDASYAEAGLDYEYFLVTDANFPDHERNEEYLTTQFYREYPMASENYDPSDDPGPKPTEPEPTDPEPTEPEPTEPADPQPTIPAPDKTVDSGNCGDNATWTLSANGVLTISGTGPMTDYEDPYGDHFPRSDVKYILIEPGITHIGKNAFFELENLTAVSMPDTVTTIAWQAFSWCESLTEVAIPSSVTSIEGYAFNGTAIRSIRIPASVTAIAQGVFGRCSNLTEIRVDAGNPAYYSVDGVLFSSDGWLMQCPAGLKGNYSAPNGTTWLYHYAFTGCESLTSVTLPTSLVGVGAGAFRDCTGLTEIFFTGDAPSFRDEGEENVSPSFENVIATVYYPRDNSTWTRDIRKNYGGTITWASYDPNVSGFCGANLTWNLSGSTLTISGNGSMYNWDTDNPAPWYNSRLDITKVVINSGVTSIGDRAFAGLEKATSVSIPSTVTSLGEDAFFCCVKLTSVTLPSGLTSIGDSAFGSCSKLTSISIPGSVKVIGAMAFSYCDDLTSVTLREGLEIIDRDAFLYCDHLPEITIPSTVHTINYSAFGDCTALTKITFLGNAPKFGQYVFDEVVATAYYPAGNKTWTSDVRQDYGGTIKWVASGDSSVKNPFTDVKKSDYYYDAVMWAVSNGITSGTSANKFSPNMTCSRGQVVTFLWRAAGEPEPTSTVNPFSDVKSSDYFYKAVLWAVENGITSGTGNGKFSPNAACTRGQVATFLWRAEGEPEAASGKNPFSDVKSSDFYYDAVLWAVENGITSGTGNGKFSPNNACSRGQIVTFLYRAYQ